MPEILSQAEIDELLASLHKDTDRAEYSDEGKFLQSYDFRRPRKFAKENIRTMQALMETFARSFSTNISGWLRAKVTCVLDSIEQLTYDEFSRSLPSPTLISIITVQPNGGPGVVEINLPVVFGLLDRMLGGPGGGAPMSRELTDIETVLMEDVVRRLLADMANAISSVAEISFRFERMEMRPQLAQVVAPNETVINICLDTSASSHEGYINVCLPYASIEHLLEVMTPEDWLTTAGFGIGQASQEKMVSDEILYAHVPLSVELGRTHITLAEAKDLAEGQVIRLDCSVGDPVLVKVGTRPAFLGRPGIHNGQMAIQVKSGIEDLNLV